MVTVTGWGDNPNNMYINGRSDDLFHPFFVGTKSTNDKTFVFAMSGLGSHFLSECLMKYHRLSWKNFESNDVMYLFGLLSSCTFPKKTTVFLPDFSTFLSNGQSGPEPDSRFMSRKEYVLLAEAEAIGSTHLPGFLPPSVVEPGLAIWME